MTDISFSMMLFVISLVSVGFLLGIMFELINYRSEIRNHVKYLSNIRDEVNTNIDVSINRLDKIESKVEGLDMFINSKR